MLTDADASRTGAVVLAPLVGLRYRPPRAPGSEPRLRPDDVVAIDSASKRIVNGPDGVVVTVIGMAALLFPSLDSAIVPPSSAYTTSM